MLRVGDNDLAPLSVRHFVRISDETRPWIVKDGGFNTLCGDVAVTPLQADCIESVQLPCVEARSFPKAGCGPQPR